MLTILNNLIVQIFLYEHEAIYSSSNVDSYISGFSVGHSLCVGIFSHNQRL